MNSGIKQVSLDEMFPVMEEKLKNGGRVVFKPKGTSMLPLIRQGKDRVALIKPSSRLKKNDIPFYRRSDGSFILHRIVSVEKDGSYTMCGDNQTLIEKGVTADMIVGVVDKVYRGERCYGANSLVMKAFCVYSKIRRIYRKTFLKRLIDWGLRKCGIKK